jgi:hypothetical protein
VDLTVLGYLAFIVQLFLKYRNTGWFKGIYIFPAGLAFLVVLSDEYERFYAWCKSREQVRLFADSVIAALLVLYVIDATFLAGQLSVGAVSEVFHETSLLNELKMFLSGS